MTPATLPTHLTVDTSDEYFAAVLISAYNAHERYTLTNDLADLRTWVELDREAGSIRDARQRDAQKTGRELKVRMG